MITQAEFSATIADFDDLEPTRSPLYGMALDLLGAGYEVEAYLLANSLVTPTTRPADAPTNQPCAHEMPAAGSPTNIQFLRRS